MSPVTTPSVENTLPPLRRLVTGHDAKGTAVFEYEGSVEQTEFIEGPGKIAKFGVPWTTQGFPIDLQTGQDGAKAKKGELTRENGTVVRFVDFPPHSRSPMHRTVSLDYGIVLSGELDLELDNGVTKRIGPSTTVVQQGTIHAWYNPNDTYARMVFILIDAKPVVVDGEALGPVTIH